MLVDYEKVVAGLLDELGARPNWGRDQVRALVARLIGENRVHESSPEEAFRLYGIQLHEDLRAAARQEAVVEAPGTDPPNHAAGSSAGAMAERSDDQSTEDRGGLEDGRRTEGRRRAVAGRR